MPSASDVAVRVHELTQGKGADIVFNTVGDPYFEAAHKSLAAKILIAATGKIVPFNIFEFYRGRHTYVGIDTLALSSVESARHLRARLPGFADGSLRPFPIEASAVYRLEDATSAYRAVLGSARKRIILKPWDYRTSGSDPSA
jgi:NADPH:quinone reductase